MRKSVTALAVAGAVAAGGAALAGPALAEGTAPSASSTSSTSSTDSTDSTDDATADRPDRPDPRERVTEALAGLVTDGTITQDQSDAVAGALAEQLPTGGPGGHRGTGPAGIGPREVAAAAAQALGVDEDELRDELRSGSSVADVAQERGVDLDTVSAAVTEAAETAIAQAVTDGRITQERADALTADLADRIAAELDAVHEGGPGGGPGGRPGSGPGGEEAPDPATALPAPSAEAPSTEAPATS